MGCFKSNFNPSRRRFIKRAVVAGVAVYLAPLYRRAYAALFEQKILQSPNWDAKNKRIRFRIDGRAKVMGHFPLRTRRWRNFAR